tara:strand:+ start:104 stop:535 length:432 start_codon:yes stop_codon:yes gene_type:complete
MKLKSKKNLEKIYLNIPETKSNISLFTSTGLCVSYKYERVVFGGKSPFVEFKENQIISKSFYIPKNQLFRLSDPQVYYVEFRSNDSANIKLQYQLRKVRYSTYKLGHFYISINDLHLEDGSRCAHTKNILDANKNLTKFFEYS